MYSQKVNWKWGIFLIFSNYTIWKKADVQVQCMSKHKKHDSILKTPMSNNAINPLQTVLIYGRWEVCRYFCWAANWMDRHVEPKCW